MKKKIVAFLLVFSLMGVSFVAGTLIAPVLAANAPASQPWNINTFYEVYRLINREYVEPNVDERKLVYDGIRGMLKSLDDPYTRFMDPESFNHLQTETKGSFGGVGMQLGIKNAEKERLEKEGKLPKEAPKDALHPNGQIGEDRITVIAPIEDTPAFKAGIKAGDYILSIDGKSTKTMSLEEAVSHIRGEVGTKVKILIQREGVKEPLSFELVRAIIEIKSVKAKMLDNNVAYVRLSAFNEKSAEEMAQALKEVQSAKGIILDLRGNPGGLLNSAIDIGSMFISSGPIVHVVDRKGTKQSLNAEGTPLYDKGPLVVLVDKGSASASEILSGALQDTGRAKLIGTTTFGKGLVQTIHPLSDGSGVAITTAKYLTPNGRDINKKGIDPDVRVELTDQDIKNQNDVQLKKAQQVINAMLAGKKITLN